MVDAHVSDLLTLILPFPLEAEGTLMFAAAAFFPWKERCSTP